MAALPNGQNAPPGAAEAVLKPSDPVPEDARQVKGIEFDMFAGRSVTVEQLLEGYANMGFQASAVGEAVHIINGMVRNFLAVHDVWGGGPYSLRARACVVGQLKLWMAATGPFHLFLGTLI
jgi:hypothetical protein